VGGWTVPRSPSFTAEDTMRPSPFLRSPLGLLALLSFAASCDRGELPVAPLPGAPHSNVAAVDSVGGRIAFVSDRGGMSYEIYVMNADATGITRLTTDTTFDLHPVWSPDGSQIAFFSNRDGNWEVYVMNRDGSGATRLTNSGPNVSYWPSWCGSQIAFSSDRGGSSEIYVMNADGTGVRQVTTNGGGYPAWSPTCQQIVFNRASNLYVVNADGTGERQLTTNGGLYAAWSPDGTQIAFTSYRDFNGEIYVVNADGTGETRLTNDGNGFGCCIPQDEFPSWSPDGRIVYPSSRDAGGHTDIYVMNADGTAVTRLTADAFNDSHPAWTVVEPGGATLVGR
jgi:Tol biopolymer transport system component